MPKREHWEEEKAIGYKADRPWTANWWATY
jgi:hypothetical protein